MKEKKDTEIIIETNYQNMQLINGNCLQFVFTSFPNRFSCEFHITQDDGDSEDDDYSDEEFDAEDANDTLMSVHLDTFLEKRYQFILVPLFVCLCEHFN